MGKITVAPSREEISSLSALGIRLHPDALTLAYDDRALASSYGGSGLKDLFDSRMVLLAASAATIGGLLFGFDQGILSISLTMPQFQEQFPETNAEVNSSASLNKGVMTALLELGAFLGAFMSGYVSDRYSRKGSLAFGMVWFIIGSVLQSASYSFAQLVVGRFIGGIGIGVLSSTAPTYISEIAPPNIRGALLVLEQFSIVLGIVVMYYITYGSRYLSGDGSFRLPFALQMFPCIILGGFLYQLPYSPRWLALRGRDKDCLESLCRLRQLPDTDPRVQAEWITIRAEAIRNREVLVRAHPSMADQSTKSELKLELASWVDMFKAGSIRQTMIGILLMFFQQFVGINALVYYAPTLFEQLGLDYELQLTLSGALNIAQLVAVVAAFFFLDKFGRKIFLIVGAIGLTASHAVVAAMIGTYSDNWPAHKGPAWVGVGFIFGVMIFYGVGWGPVPWAMPAEIHPSSRRAKGVAITTCSNWLNNFIIGLITPPLVSGTKGYGAFIFFAIWSTLAGIWSVFFVPETKGRTLEQMDAVFKSRTAIEDAQARDDILQIICKEALNSTNNPGQVPKEEIEMVENVDEKKSGTPSTISTV
ncbi:monosaccharide transporter [Cryptococcus deuterogattii R265]|uniref:monosaccharide transporter n=1 Tax=Cryptococcus deuterogattii (strain R265) TaxID=294750 RepID=UPI00193906BA|nr:monosaccharide transporter [Cryptococcus deuterogattii R265]